MYTKHCTGFVWAAGARNGSNVAIAVLEKLRGQLILTLTLLVKTDNWTPVAEVAFPHMGYVSDTLAPPSFPFQWIAFDKALLFFGGHVYHFIFETLHSPPSIVLAALKQDAHMPFQYQGRTVHDTADTLAFEEQETVNTVTIQSPIRSVQPSGTADNFYFVGIDDQCNANVYNQTLYGTQKVCQLGSSEKSLPIALSAELGQAVVIETTGLVWRIINFRTSNEIQKQSNLPMVSGLDTVAVWDRNGYVWALAQDTGVLYCLVFTDSSATLQTAAVDCVALVLDF